MSDTAAVGYALLFSVPVGVGVVLAFGQTTGRLSPLALGFGLAVGAAVFVLVVAGAHGDHPAEDNRDP